jgi:hypothetical protein
MENKLELPDLISLIDSASPTFEILWSEGMENERRWMGKNYSEAQDAEIRAQRRQPISISQSSAKIRRVLGVQQTQRTEFDILAANDPNDEPKAELAKLQIHSIERRSGFMNLESEVCTAGLATKYGVSAMRLDYSNLFPRVKVEKVDYKDFMWDANSKEFDLNEDALWVCELDKLTRRMVNQEYGIPKDEVSKLTEGNTSSFQGREKNSIYLTKNANGQNDFDILTIFKFYLKTPRNVWYVVFPDSESLNGAGNVLESKHNTKDAAEKRLRELQLPYLMENLPLEGSVEHRIEKGIDKYRFTYDRLIDVEETDLEMFPYNVYFATRFENLIASFMDYLKDPQKFYDRFVMQIDYALGKDNRQATQLNVNGLAEEETATSALQKIERGETVLVKSYEQVLQGMKGGAANPQWMGMIDLLTVILNDLGGGQQFQAKGNASDSGRKAEAMIGQGALYAKPFLDNLRRWKILVGRNMLWWMQHYEEAKDVIRVQGGALSPQMVELLTKNGIYAPSQLNDGSGFVTLNEEGKELSYLRDSAFELVVTEEAMSDTEKHTQFLIASTEEQKDPMLLQSMEWRKYKLSLLDIPMNVRFAIMKELDDIKKQQAQMMEQQQAQLEQQNAEKVNLEKAKILSKHESQAQMSRDRSAKLGLDAQKNAEQSDIAKAKVLSDVASS